MAFPDFLYVAAGTFTNGVVLVTEGKPRWSRGIYDRSVGHPALGNIGSKSSGNQTVPRREKVRRSILAKPAIAGTQKKQEDPKFP